MVNRTEVASYGNRLGGFSWKWQYQRPPSEGVGGGVVLFILMVLVEGYFNFNIQLRIENNELIPMNEFMG